MIATSHPTSRVDLRPSEADQALRTACQPFIRAAYDQQGVVSVDLDQLTPEHLNALRDAATEAHPRTRLRLAVQPILDRMVTSNLVARTTLDRVSDRDWIRLHRVDASAQALVPVTEGELAQIDRAFVEAVQPFANAVYNDNGDVTITRSHIRDMHWIALYNSYEGISIDHPLRSRAVPFIDLISIRNDRAIVMDHLLDPGDWLRLRNGWLECVRKGG